MINIKDINKSAPYRTIKKLYKKALYLNQDNIDAMIVTSLDKNNNYPDARFVNLKFINDTNFIFFSNYNSPKAKQFESNNHVTCLIFWSKINIQIRMRGRIDKTDNEFNQKYFFNRSEKKNALAISSNQSEPIDSYNLVKENYEKVLKNYDLNKCPIYWGGFSFTPYYFEFWKGHKSRINRREAFYKIDDNWKRSFLQP